MSTIDRCTCIPHYQDAGGGYTEYVPELEPSCSEHGEADEILASGKYTDRRGRAWGCIPGTYYWSPMATDNAFVRNGIAVPGERIRLLIERDQHRDVCVGLHWCDAHPVPRVHFNIHTRAPIVVAGNEYIFPDGGFSSHAAAMDAARALAVGDV